MATRILLLNLLLSLTLLAGCAARLEPHAPTSEAGGVRFTVKVASARSVAVAGAFNGWSATSHPMARIGSEGPWSLVIPLAPGEQPFMYVVDGTQWLSPPQADDYLDDGFGNRNGVVVVRGAEGRR